MASQSGVQEPPLRAREHLVIHVVLHEEAIRSGCSSSWHAVLFDALRLVIRSAEAVFCFPIRPVPRNTSNASSNDAQERTGASKFADSR